MSYAVMPYALKLDNALSVIGCENEEAFANMARRNSSQLDRIDELIEDNGHGDQISARSAMRDLYFHGDYQKAFSVGYVYGYVFKVICGAYGEVLHNESWSGMRYDWFEEVNAELKAAGVTFDTTDLVSGGGGTELPIDDFPQIGHLRLARITSLHADLAAIPPRTLRDPETRAAIRELQRWFKRCVADRLDLVCFYH
jgi:hypothetical protein